MKKTTTVLLSLVLIACFAQSALALETTWYPGSVPVGLDARSFGMGGACLAVPDARTNPINPAALVFLTDQGVFAGRFVNPGVDPVLLLGEQEYLYLSYVHPDEKSGAYSLTFSQNEFYNEYDTGTIVHTGTKFTALQYGYGYKLNDQISLGFNLRRVNTLDRIESVSGITDVSSAFLTFDAGAVFRPNKMLTASILVTDVFAPDVSIRFDLDGDGTEDPVHYLTKTRVLFGGSLRVGNLLLLAADVDFNIEGFVSFWESTRLGAELRLGLVVIRGGFYHGDPTVGIGFKLGNRDGMEINLDFGQIFPSSGEFLSPVQCMQMVVYF